MSALCRHRTTKSAENQAVGVTSAQLLNTVQRFGRRAFHEVLPSTLDPPKDVYGPDFPRENFRVLNEKEMKQYGEDRTRRLVLEKWDEIVD